VLLLIANGADPGGLVYESAVESNSQVIRVLEIGRVRSEQEPQICGIGFKSEGY
jgi:hypothetical protein